MAPPIGIRYYNCLNAGIGIIIWPQLRSSANPDNVLWDAPSGSPYKLFINGNVTLDLATTNLKSTDKFYLSEYTMAGRDLYDTSQEFYYDSESTITAFGVKYGGADDGSLLYTGCKGGSLASPAKRLLATEPLTANEPGGSPLETNPLDAIVAVPLAKEFQSYANAVADLRLQEFLSEMFDGYNPPQSPWKGIVRWIAGSNPNFVAGGITTIILFLIARRYQCTYTSFPKPDGSIFTHFYFGPTQLTGPVPAKVVADWDDAVKKVQGGGKNPVNEGVTTNKLNSEE